MTNQEILELLDRFEKSSLTGMKLSMDGFLLELSREAGTPGRPAEVCTGKEALKPERTKPGADSADTAKEPGHFITAPMVGTYYAASAPQQAPFVMPGDRVFKGQTVCLMEAMKMISEIPAPCDCIIEEILKADGDMAAYGEPLFQYQPC